MLKRFLLICLLFFVLPSEKLHAESVEPVHYAYANYLGSGIYRAAEQDILFLLVFLAFLMMIFPT